MALLAMRRRVGRLEGVFVDRLAGCLPLNQEEIEVLAGRLADGGAWTDEEEARVASRLSLRFPAACGLRSNGPFVSEYPTIRPEMLGRIPERRFGTNGTIREEGATHQRQAEGCPGTAIPVVEAIVTAAP